MLAGVQSYVRMGKPSTAVRKRRGELIGSGSRFWRSLGACFQVFGGTQDAQEAIDAIQIGRAVDILR